MKGWLAVCAAMLVRLWTRAYTRGMDVDVRQRRRTEIESDLWESLHDAETTGATSVRTGVRLVRGMWADIAWRLDNAPAGGPMWRKIALASIPVFAAIATLWVMSSRPGPLPSLPAKPLPYHVERRQGPPPPPPPPPSWEEFVAKVSGKTR